jgi:hypothetical protein
MHRFVRRLTLLLVFVLLGTVVVLPASAQATQTTYREGISVHQSSVSRVSNPPHINLTATKHVNGGNAYTEVRLDVFYGGGPYKTINTTVRLPGDPDELEVSNDLGWGGLNGTVWVQQSTQTCQDYYHMSGCAITSVETVAVDIHLAVYGSGNAQFDGTYYRRRAGYVQRSPETRFARVSGTVAIRGGTRFEFGTRPVSDYTPEGGSNFSTRAPFPD